MVEHEKPTFNGLGIAPAGMQFIDRMKFTQPTPIQHKAIPIALEGNDVMGIAQTGTGKTLAFGMPMMQRLSQEPGVGLILVPTRELAIQVNDTLRKLSTFYRKRSVVIIGGAPMQPQIRDLRQRPDIIVATPGRLMDHLRQRTVRLENVNIVVLDEADRMLDMGFEPQINEIMRTIPKKRQTMLFSATMPHEIVHLAHSYMKTPTRVEIATSGTVAEKVTQELFIVKRGLKNALLATILNEYRGMVLVFSRTRHGAHDIARSLKKAGHTAADIHSDKTLAQRKEALDGFKSGRYRVLVATDIAARGIDVTGIELVVNYDIPEDAENYIHRIGRTGRAGHAGHAISFAYQDQDKDVRDIEQLMRVAIPISKHPEYSAEKFCAPAPAKKVFRGITGRSRFRSGGFRSGGFGGGRR